MPTDLANPNKKLPIPAWIQDDYFLKVLQKDEPDFKEILKFTPVAAIPAGENFTSNMIRAHLSVLMKDGSKKVKTYIVKSMHEDPNLDDFNLFTKEKQMYLQYLPAFESLYEAAGRSVRLGPRCFQIDERGTQRTMIFEDLKALNFENLQKQQGCNMECMRLVLKKLAEYHAASAVYFEQNGPFPENFQSGFFSNAAVDFQKHNFDLKIKPLMAIMAEWCKTDEEKMFIEKMPTSEQFVACGLKTLEVNENDFNCLTHGDFWSSNVMFSFKQDKSFEDAILLDFQFCKWGSPFDDLHFFITISAAKDIRIKEFDTMVEIYYENLIDCLTVLNYQKPKPKLRDLQIAMYRENVTFFPFFGWLNHLPIILFPDNEKCVMENLMGDDEASKKLHHDLLANPEFVAQSREILSFYHKKGIFKFEDFN